jgi:hypothetical protein
MSEGNGYATADQLFGSRPERRYKDVTVDGHKFRLRSLLARESNPWAVKSQTDRGAASAGARLIVLCCVNASNDCIFDSKDVANLLDMDAAFVAKLAKECQSHAGIQDDVELEDAEKN